MTVYRDNRPTTHRDRRQAALMAALGLAMSACRGVADDDAMLRAVERIDALPPDLPLAGMVHAIGRNWRHLRRNPEALQQRGDELLRAVRRETWPDASTRADLEG